MVLFTITLVRTGCLVMNEDFGNTSSRWWLGPKEYSDYEDR